MLNCNSVTTIQEQHGEMTEFWEASFRDKKEMWGSAPADSALAAFELFKQQGLNKILVPGFGYGRNAKIFAENGFDVTGIEISATAIELAKTHFDDSLVVHHGSVGDMPFDEELYDGIFCYALLHLLNEKERKKLIADCYKQLKPGGCMFFVSLSKSDARYAQGTEISKDTFETRHGVTLFFYDSDSINTEFGNAGLIDATEISEPAKPINDKPPQRFWQIICKKSG